MAAAGEPTQAYVWVWLPMSTEPVVAGRVWASGAGVYSFTYGRSYLERDEAIPLSLPELPLMRGTIGPSNGLQVAGCLRDAGPDSWGQRIILHRHLGTRDSEGKPRDTAELGLLTYLLESGSDRIGALDFQASPTEYVPRGHDATLQQLQRATEAFLAGHPLPEPLEEALLHGTSVGGAQPKALVAEDLAGGGRRELIAKMSSSTDRFPVVKAEAAAMTLAEAAGVDVAATQLVRSLDREVLLVERFDRPGTSGSAPGPLGSRRAVVSALTLLGLDEMVARYGTYPDLADLVRARFSDPDATLRELFRRIVVNICVSNTDDHPRNHAAFWDGKQLTLTPAYDITPSRRSGDTAAQAMAIDRRGRRTARLSVCVDAADIYHLDRAEAAQIVDEVTSSIAAAWGRAADEARLTAAERELMWKHLVLNPAIHYADA
jgi:serine/threonine-protein kinase HipA